MQYKSIPCWKQELNCLLILKQRNRLNNEQPPLGPWEALKMGHGKCPIQCGLSQETAFSC